MGAQGSFVAINNVVSQSVPHLHTHIVPRVRKDGLRGFFWPRTKYEHDDHAAETAAKVRPRSALVRRELASAIERSLAGSGDGRDPGRDERVRERGDGIAARLVHGVGGQRRSLAQHGPGTRG